MPAADATRRTRLFGRDEAIKRVLDVATSSSASPLVVVSGPVGIGRSSVLSSAREQLASRDVATLGMRVAQNEHARPYAVAARLISELGGLRGAERPGRGATLAESRNTRHISAVGGADSGPAMARRMAAALAGAIGEHRQLVLFLDDLQWIDPDSRTALAPLVRTLAGTSITVVCALRSPMAGPAAQAGRALLDRLRDKGLAEVVRLRPLGPAHVNALLTDVLRATPTPRLSAVLNHSSRGVPAAVLAAVEGYRQADSLRVVDGYGYLAHPAKPPTLPSDHPVFDHLRRSPGWPVIKALAVLAPLGAAASGLIAEVVGSGEEQVVEVLYTLRAEGVLRTGPTTGSWRFRLPLLASTLASCLGPFERRQLAQVAVDAIWDGRASSRDEEYLPEQLVSAGRLVDPERAATELLASGTAAMLDDGYFAGRWLHAATELTNDPAQRADALSLHAATRCLHGEFRLAMDSARLALNGAADQFAANTLQDLEIIYVTALRGSNSVAELENVVADEWRSLPGEAAHQLVTRAAALCMLDRWRDARELLSATRGRWRNSNDSSAGYGLAFGAVAGALLGEGAEFERLLTEPNRWPPHQVDRFRLEALVRILLVQGEWDRAERLLADHELPRQQRPLVDQAMLAALSGQWDVALELGRLSELTGASLGQVPGHTGMCLHMATILASRGQLAQARTLIEQARSTQPVHTHLLDLAEADVEDALGATDQAQRLVANGLAVAADGGLVVGTDELWLRLAECELARGNRERAEQCADEVRRVAERLGTGRARRSHLLARVAVHHDQEAATEAVRLARERGQPFELAGTLTSVATHGLGDAVLLREAYELLGALDALMPRAQVRHLMRARGVAVPGRSETVAENERLLAALVAEGLTNRQLATILRATEKSVESRLSRLFLRTGYRSRVELATAMLTGEYRY